LKAQRFFETSGTTLPTRQQTTLGTSSFERQYAFCEIGTGVLPVVAYAAESKTMNKDIPDDWLLLEGKF
jgi:hypothetical protein